MSVSEPWGSKAGQQTGLYRAILWRLEQRALDEIFATPGGRKVAILTLPATPGAYLLTSPAELALRPVSTSTDR